MYQRLRIDLKRPEFKKKEAFLGTKLLVTNLPLNIDSATLEDMFTMVGNVRAAKVALDGATGVSQGVGYVEMTTVQEAQDCIDRLNGQSKHGQRISVRVDKPHVPNVTAKPIGRKVNGKSS